MALRLRASLLPALRMAATHLQPRLPTLPRFALAGLRRASNTTSTAPVSSSATPLLFKGRTHTCGELRLRDEQKSVILFGWVQHVRNVGEDLTFVVLRDPHGTTQLVIQDPATLATIRSLPEESIIGIQGHVRGRPSGMANTESPTGDIEVVVDALDVMNVCAKLPFPISRKASVANEEIRMKYRYLDLRRQDTQDIIRLRSKIALETRNFLADKHGFIEVETPTLFKRTPGGAAEFLVPTQDKGKFYALVQSPQQYKQLLMVGGADRYMQFARCYRDEGGRGDRQPEFTQIDLEVSFATQRLVQDIVEDLVHRIWKVALGDSLYPFPRMTYRHAMDNYGVDKPDTRYDMRLMNLSQSFVGNKTPFVRDALDKGGVAIGMRMDGAETFFTRKSIDDVQEHARGIGGPGVVVVALTPEGTFKSPFAKNLTEEERKSIVGQLGMKPGDVGFIAFGNKKDTTLSFMGKMRIFTANMLEKGGLLKRDPKQFNFLWIEDFPLFETHELDPSRIQACHHAFTAPHPDDVALLASDPMKVRGQHFDLVLNGVELGGGSIRNHRYEDQLYILKDILGEDASVFEQLLEGLRYGAPPHGGLAIGFDRLMMILCGTGSIRDVIAFPKSFAGKELMSCSPTPIPAQDLETYHIAVKP